MKSKLDYEEKNIAGGVKDVDRTTRRVKVAVSQMETEDLDRDVIDKDAYKVTIKQRGPKGSQLIWHLTDHNASFKDAISKPHEIFTEDGFLVFISDVRKTSHGNDMMEFYDNGDVNQHSVGFRTVKWEDVNPDKATEYRLIKEIHLYEGSAVLWGAQPNTPTLSVGKSLEATVACPRCKELTENVEVAMGYIKCAHCEKTFSLNEVELAKQISELTKISKMFKNGHLTDETYELLDLKIAQTSSRIKQLFELTSAPAGKAVHPVNELSEVRSSVVKDFLKTIKN